MSRDEAGDVLAEAADTVNRQRMDQYGKPEDSFEIIAAFWTTYLTGKFKECIPVEPCDVAIMMSLFKHARMVGQKYTRDNPRDACGYLSILADRIKKGVEDE